jgi:serine/threonine protein kinase/tetratricopeptide (TPR) repeat protein
MNPDRWEKVKVIFNSALELSPEERDEYLESVCGPEPEIRKAVDGLIAAYRTSFLDNTFPPHDSMPKEYVFAPGSSLRHYEIVKLLGEGGMGQVYLAYDQRLARNVAIKVYSTDSYRNRDQLVRFIREARAASALNHPNICTVYEIDPEHEPPYIAMEYVEGRSLADIIANRRIGVEQAIDIMIQVGDGLAKAHEAGIVHRDIKPENIIISESGVAKLVDFGIAKKVLASADDRTERRLSHAGMIIGTISYMSPEQARGKEVDARSDIWSMGVIFYELLTGELPFKGETPGDIISEILRSDPPSAKTHDSRISEEINRVIVKTLAKEKDERYAKARHLVADLKKIKARRIKFEDDQTASSTPNQNGNTTLILGEQTGDAEPAVTRRISRQVLHKSSYIVTGVLVLVVAAFGLAYFIKPSAPLESLAVMPFANETGNPESEYLSDGITESLIGRLSQIPNLSVKARSSVFRFKGKDVAIQTVGKELNVPAVLTGHVSRRQNQFILYVELVDTATENIIWRAEYNRPESSLATIPGEIARDVANNIRFKLSGAEERQVTRNYTDNGNAYELYLKGRYYWDKRNEEAYKVATDAYNQAIALDSNYALAYAGLADCYLFREAGLGRDVAMPKAKEYALKALEIDESLAEAHTTLAFVHANYDLDFSSGEKEFNRAIQLKPNYAIAHQFYGSLLIATGRTDEALAEMQKAVDLEPYSASINWSLGLGLGFARRYGESIAQLQKTLQIQPNFALAEGTLSGMYIQAGRFDEATELVQKHLTMPERREVALSNLAIIYAKTGRAAEAQKTLDLLSVESKSQNNPYSIARVYAALGERDKAINWLNKALERKSFSIWFLRVDPFFDALHEEPAFQELLRRIGVM